MIKKQEDKYMKLTNDKLRNFWVSPNNYTLFSLKH